MSKGLIFGLESKQEPLEKWTKRSKLAKSVRVMNNFKLNNSSRKMYQICIKMFNPCGPQVDIFQLLVRPLFPPYLKRSLK